MGSFIAACGFLKPSIEDREMNYFWPCPCERSSASVKTNTTNTLKYGQFWTAPFIPALRIKSGLSARTKDRRERLLCKIIMSLKEKFARRQVLNVKKCLSRDRFSLTFNCPLVNPFHKA